MELTITELRDTDVGSQISTDKQLLDPANRTNFQSVDNGSLNYFGRKIELSPHVAFVEEIVVGCVAVFDQNRHCTGWLNLHPYTSKQIFGRELNHSALKVQRL